MDASTPAAVAASALLALLVLAGVPVLLFSVVLLGLATAFLRRVDISVHAFVDTVAASAGARASTVPSLLLLTLGQSALKVFVGAVASSLSGPVPVPQRTHHLSAEDPLCLATIERHERPVHMGACGILGFLALSSTTGLALILNKHVSAFRISVSLELLLYWAKNAISSRVWAIGRKLYAPGLSAFFDLVVDWDVGAFPPFLRASVGGVCGGPGDFERERDLSTDTLLLLNTHSTANALVIGLSNS